MMRLRDWVQDWRAIETAPVEPVEKVNPYTYRFRCLLQDRHGDVFEGDGHYIKLNRRPNTPTWTLRWYRANARVCDPQPIYWMPLPAPKEMTDDRSG